MTTRLTKVRKKDIRALSHATLVDLVWTLTAMSVHSAFCDARATPRTLPSITPGAILSPIEAATQRYLSDHPYDEILRSTTR